MGAYSEPEFLPWDGRRVPMTFLAGYLGAGKTTLLNEVLAVTDRPIAVLVNDVGEINIDAKLVRRRSGDAIELTDGCVCCSLSEGFGVAIDTVRARSTPPDHVVVELSGVADPARVLPWARTAGFRLDGVMTLVDVDALSDRLADRVSATTIRAQLAAADVVVLTKLDLADAEAAATARRAVADLAPGAAVLERGPEAVARLVDLGTRRPGGTDRVPDPTLFDAHVTTTVALPDPVDRPALDEILDRLGPSVVRVKGIARATDGARLLVQVVGRRRSITPLPAAEDEAPTDLVVISVPTGPTPPPSHETADASAVSAAW